MQPVNIGIIGLGNVGEGTLTILTENAAHIEAKLGFPLRVVAVCSRGIAKTVACCSWHGPQDGRLA